MFPWHCQSKFVHFATTSEPDFVAIDFPAFFRVDLSGSMAAPSIYNFALATPTRAVGPALLNEPFLYPPEG
jgi:hypothetical protein